SGRVPPLVAAPAPVLVPPFPTRSQGAAAPPARVTEVPSRGPSRFRRALPPDVRRPHPVK
ncbi:hypothetical protein, partial [Streptomyces somaliensis]|uniref:hypothetical protein n=1 Tax=Streptomyces somaliensis TaxID=78355 RepID=UPI00263ABE08